MPNRFRIVLFVLLGFSLQSPIGATESVRPPIESLVPNLRFKDIRYLPRSLNDFGNSNIYVLIFSNTTCPLVQKYWPKLSRMQLEYAKSGVQFLGVNVGTGDDIADMAQQAIDFEITFPLVKDVDGSCTRALGIERTPEVAIIGRDRKLKYRGRIDDQYRLTGARVEVGEDNLKTALEDVLADRAVVVKETAVDGCRITLPAEPKLSHTVTYFQHVLPLLQKHCQECHHDGGNAPFSLMTLEDVKTHAEAVAEVVSSRQMPPWFAHRAQKFENERGLTLAERELVVAWARTGTASGDPAEGPMPLKFERTKWEIGTPDLVTTAVETHTLPADGFVDYKYVLLPYIFLEDTWISATEILPSNPAVVHHCNMGYVSLGKEFDENNFITGRVPGGTAMELDKGVGFKIPKNSVIGLQIHYTTTGKKERNRMSVGFKFPRDVIHRELHHLQVTTSRFEIPPEAQAHPVSASRVLPSDATGIGMFSHMHLRGKDMTFKAQYPNGEEETLLSIPNYHYDWQQNYRWKPGTRVFPKGTRIEVTAHYDNSKFNPFNPNSQIAVRHGPQTIHEMMFGFFFYTSADEELNLKVDPRTGQEVK